MTPEEAATRRFWEEFFNLGDPEAFDRLAASDGAYTFNGAPDDGTFLKQWLAGLKRELFINVSVDHLVRWVDPVSQKVMIGIYWTSRSRTRPDYLPSPPTHGVNILKFNADMRVVENWHVRGPQQAVANGAGASNGD